jgi:tRNA pseudouridine55 synthase
LTMISKASPFKQNRSAPVDGVLIVDKDPGMTSHDVVRRVRRLLKTRRVGHAGTLDPLATGVLPVAVGEGTRIVQFLMEGDKTYRATFRLGEITDTQDCEGQVLETRPVTGVTETMITAAASSLTGTIRQIPPMYSALKREGVPLHRLARQGLEVPREAREVRIDRISIREIRLPLMTVEVDCSKGTYIRTLCHDLGMLLGCGAHLTALRRTRNGVFREDESLPLGRLEEVAHFENSPLLSLRQALRGYPSLAVAPDAVGRLLNGIPPSLVDVEESARCEEGDTVVLVAGQNLLAIARFAPSRRKEKRGDFELFRVFNRSGGI